MSLPKLEKVQINLHRPIPEGFAVKQVRIVKKAVGWFAIVSISSDVEIPQPLPHGHFIGVDVGLLNYLATSARSNCFPPLNGGKACERFRRTRAQIFQNRASSAESATTQALEENEAF